MTPLVVEKSIDIDVSPSKVWAVLTKPELTREWATMFGAAGPIESDWRPGSRVAWRNADGKVYVEGRVTDAQRDRRLQFTVRDVNRDMQPVSGREEDDITQTYTLRDDGGRTHLATAHGDFSKLANGAQLLPRVIELWDALLPKLKALSEGT
jgi:uncharacterized protein YndB with AHSA1/START domain